MISGLWALKQLRPTRTHIPVHCHYIVVIHQRQEMLRSVRITESWQVDSWQFAETKSNYCIEVEQWTLVVTQLSLSGWNLNMVIPRLVNFLVFGVDLRWRSAKEWMQRPLANCCEPVICPRAITLLLSEECSHYWIVHMKNQRIELWFNHHPWIWSISFHYDQWCHLPWPRFVGSVPNFILPGDRDIISLETLVGPKDH